MMATMGKRAKATPWQQNFLTKANKTFADAGQEEPYIVNPLAGSVPRRQMAATTGQPAPLITSGSTTPSLSASQPVATTQPVMAEQPPQTETFVNPETGRRETREAQRVIFGKQANAVSTFDEIEDVGDGQVIDLGGANPISGAENSTISLDDVSPEVRDSDVFDPNIGIPIYTTEGTDDPHFVSQSSDGKPVALPVGEGSEVHQRWTEHVNNTFQADPNVPAGVGANNQGLFNDAIEGGPGHPAGKIIRNRINRDQQSSTSSVARDLFRSGDGWVNAIYQDFPGDAAAADAGFGMARAAYERGEIEAEEFKNRIAETIGDITSQIAQRDEDFANILNETLQRGEAQVDRANKREDVLTGRVIEAYEQEQGRMDARNMRSGLGRGSTALRPALARLQEDRARALAEARAENYDNVTRAERARDVDYLRALEAKANATQSLRADRNLANMRRAEFAAGRSISPMQGFVMGRDILQPSTNRIL